MSRHHVLDRVRSVWLPGALVVAAVATAGASAAHADTASLGPPSVELRAAATDPVDPDVDPEVDTATWGVRPVDLAGEPRPNFAVTSEPGATVNDAVLVTNYEQSALTLDVYAADAYTAADGTLSARLRDDAVEDAGAWLALESERISVPPGESMAVPFTLDIPADAEPGDHGAVILTSLVTEDAESGVAVDRRLGTRVEVHVRGDVEVAVAIDDIELSGAQSLNPLAERTMEVSYRVVNTGNVRIVGTVDVALDDLVGRDLGEWQAVVDLPEIRPGDHVDVTTALDGAAVPAIRADATISVRAVAVIDEASTFTVSRRRDAWAIPWLLVGLLVLAVAVGVRRRLRGAPTRGGPAAETDPDADQAVGDSGLPELRR